MKEGKLFNCRRVICAWSVFFCFIHHLAFSFSGWEKRPNERPAAVVKIIKTTVTLDAYFIKRKLKQSVSAVGGGGGHTLH